MNLSLRKEAQEEKRYLVDVTLDLRNRSGEEVHDLELELTELARDNGGQITLPMNHIFLETPRRPMWKQVYVFDDRHWWETSATQMFHEIVAHNFLGSLSQRAEVKRDGDWLPTPDDAQGIRVLFGEPPSEASPEEREPYEPLIEPDELES